MAELSQLQKFIDSNTTDPTGNCYSFVCIGVVGDAVIKKNVCIRFIDCKEIRGLSAEGNNVLNFDSCTFVADKSYVFNDVAVTITKCDIQGNLLFNNSKVYIAESNITGKITINSNSYCRSRESFYSSSSEQNCLVINNRSKFESYKDTYSNYTGPVFVLAEKSFAKISDPKIQYVGTVVSADDYSKIELYNLIDLNINPGYKFSELTNNSTLKVHTIPLFDIKSVGITAKNSYVFFNNADTIVTSDTFIQAENSLIEIVKASSIVNTGSSVSFTGTNCTFNLYDVNNLGSNNGCFDVTDSEIVYISNLPATIDASNGEVVKSKSSYGVSKAKLYFNNLAKISSNKVAFSLNGSSLRLSNITDIISTGNVISSNKNSGVALSTVILSDVSNISSLSGKVYDANKNSKLFASNIKSIKSKSNTFDVTEGSLYLQYLDDVVSASGNCVSAISSTCSISDIKNTTSSAVSFLINSGIYADIKNCACITGDIIIGSTQVTMSDLPEVDGMIKLMNSIATLNNVTANGLFDTDNSIVTTNDCVFNSDVNFTVSTITNQKSKFESTYTTAQSVVNNVLSKVKNINNAINSTVLNSSTAVEGSINLITSSCLNMTSSVGNIINVADGSTLISAASSGTIHTQQEGDFTGTTGAFVVGSGTLGICANNGVIDMRSYVLKETVRSNIEINAYKQYSVTINGGSTIFMDATKIDLMAPVVHSSKK